MITGSAIPTGSAAAILPVLLGLLGTLSAGR
jgi:hypothetical protein